MEEVFSQLAKEEDGKFSVNDSIYAEVGGARVSHSTYLLNFEYKGSKVIIKNELGVQSFGIVQIKFKIDKKKPNFTVETKNHFLALFSKKKETFKIKSEDLFLSNFIELNKHFLELTEIAKKSVFEPRIIGALTDYNYSITTEYSLLFKERRDVLRPLINLHKDLFDFLQR